MEFNFSHNSHETDFVIAKELELWTPVIETPTLSDKEISTLFGDESVIESLHVALPALISSIDDGQFGYTPCFELNRYYLVAKLKHSPYMVFFEEKITSVNMKNHLIQSFNQDKSSFFLFDAFFEPLYGGISPKNYLFQKVTLDSVPESVILFRDIEPEKNKSHMLFFS
jgi:hypothetical protein